MADSIPAYGVFHIKHSSLKNWQFLFIIEGVATCVTALIALFWLPYGPGSAWFLSEKDRAYAAERIRLDNVMYIQHTYGESGVEKDRLTKRDIVETARDWKLWYVLFFNILASVPGQAFSVFLPLVVAGLGYSSIQANLVRFPTLSGCLTALTSADVRATLCLWCCGPVHFRTELRSKVSASRL